MLNRGYPCMKSDGRGGGDQSNLISYSRIKGAQKTSNEGGGVKNGLKSSEVKHY